MSETAAENFTDCWFLTGATAAGKSAIGLELAKRIDAEILSLDSMAVYRDMDIGTAKPTLEERAIVKHHLIDVADPRDEFSVATFCELAANVVADLRSRNKRALFVGGTPLFLKGLLRGIETGPPADWEFRKQIEEEVAQVGMEALRERLKVVDPLSAHKLHPNDMRRMIRALEYFRATGTPISHAQVHFEDESVTNHPYVFTLHWPREELHHRIEDRVERMFASGWVDEVNRLRAKYGQLGRTASQAVGYREIAEHLDGVRSLAETIELVKARTRQFARRQETWFRGIPESKWIERSQSQTPASVADEIVRLANQPGPTTSV